MTSIRESMEDLQEAVNITSLFATQALSIQVAEGFILKYYLYSSQYFNQCQ
jgi:hypothetical protein